MTARHGNRPSPKSRDEPLLLFARALDFAAKKHVHQRRKGESAEPYINHLAEVARLLAAAPENQNAAVTVAGLLHDTLEDTETSHGELAAEFGEEIASLVREVTDNKALPKEARKKHQEEHAGHASDGAKMIKIADKTSNLLSILHSPPRGWDLARKREYFDWAKRVVAGCRGVSGYLEDEFDRAWSLGAEEFELRGK